MPEHNLPAELLKPLPKDKVKILKKDDGSQFYYYNYLDIVQLLNEHLGLNWNYQVKVLTHESTGNNPLIHCTLSVRLPNGDLAIREQFGTAFLFDGREQPFAEQVKAAASIGLTKCASLFSIGAELYDKKYLSELDEFFAGETEKMASIKSQLKKIATQKKLSVETQKEIAADILGIKIDEFKWGNLTLKQYSSLVEFIREN